MARFRIKKEFRNRLSDKLMDLGNLIAIALVIGQFVGGKEFSIPIVVVGIILAFGCYFMSFLLS